MLAIEQNNISISSNLINQLSEHICNQCPLTFEEVVTRNSFAGLNSIAFNDIRINFLSSKIQEIIQLYKPSIRYFVSFSKTNSEPLMWSHYSDMHKGFCLIFKAINGVISQSTTQIKRQIRRKTEKGFASDMSYGMPEKFKIVDIDYRSEVEQSNAFLYLPVYVSGEAKNEEERLQIRSKQESHYSQKGMNWYYENESRIILPPPPPWLFGEHIEYTKQERLFHYDPSQLVGIIYGARMASAEKNRIKEILQERKDWIDYNLTHKRIDFNFVEFEAKLSTMQRTVEISPLGIDTYKFIAVEEEDFVRLYKDWQEGVGFEINGSSSKRIKVD
jgi:hypothetical protein